LRGGGVELFGHSSGLERPIGRNDELVEGYCSTGRGEGLKNDRRPSVTTRAVESVQK
jgi:hypothetical protein